MDQKNNCYIISSYIEGELSQICMPLEEDYIICADGGLKHALQAGIKPDIVIGDFDSLDMEIPENIQTLILPSEKDITDTAQCLDYAVEQGYTSIFIVGGMGGRLDHTLANIQNIVKYSKENIKIIMVDQNNYFIALTNDSTTLPKLEGYHLSLISHTEICEGVSISGVHYPLENDTLTNDFPLGVSNEFEADFARIEVQKGTLLIVLSRG